VEGTILKGEKGGRMRLKEIAGFLLVSVTVAVMVCALLTTVSARSTEDSIRAMMADINAQLEGMGENVRLAVVDYHTSADSGRVGQTVYANDRNKQMDSHWVPGDPDRFGSTHIFWAVDQIDGSTSSGLTQVDTDNAIERAMDTWNSVRCSTIPLTRVDDFGLDLGYVQWLLGLGGVPGWLADITQAGFLPGAFFDAIEPDGSTFILGVTYTFIWLEYQGGPPTDMDNNGKLDVAFREMYYNDAFPWAIDASPDVETVVLHETGHGLSQDHFGKIFRTKKNEKLHFAPRAVMNAAYSGVQQELKGTDVGGHCSIWGSWPNN
jgi:hypothetical protein